MDTPVKEEKVDNAPVVSYTTDIFSQTMSSFSEGKTQQRSPLVKGPAGFLVAQFGDCIKTTELPNVVLDTLDKGVQKVAPNKKKAAGKTPLKVAEGKKAEVKEKAEVKAEVKEKSSL